MRLYKQHVSTVYQRGTLYKSITRSTVLLAYRKVKGKEISGPKAIGVHGDSYIYAVLKAIGVI